MISEKSAVSPINVPTNAGEHAAMQHLNPQVPQQAMNEQEAVSPQALATERILASANDLQSPTTVGQSAVELVAIASMQMKQAADELTALREEQQERAEHVWDIDRTAEVAAIALHLRQSPLEVVSKLRKSRHGADLLLHYWQGLRSNIRENGNLNEDQRSLVHDLLGHAADYRTGPFPLDSETNQDSIDRRKFMLARVDVIMNELKDLLNKHLIPLDATRRKRACLGLHLVGAEELDPILRFQREATERYQFALDILRQEAGGHEANPPARPPSIPAAQPSPSSSQTKPSPPPAPEEEDEIVEKSYVCRELWELARLPKADPDIVEERHRSFISYVTMTSKTEDTATVGQHAYLLELLTLEASAWTDDELFVVRLYCPLLS